MTEGQTLAQAEQWDVFISYAREDYIQAKDLLDALLECVTESGRPPRIYLDVSSTGTPPGVDWQSFITTALRNTRYFVVLYSTTYFKKHVCQWELNEALKLNLSEAGRLIPLLIDPGAIEHVPFSASKINWTPTTRPRWLDEVRAAVRLTAVEARPALGFAQPVADAVAGHTLPPVEIAVALPEGRAGRLVADAVTIGVEPGDAGLTGTLTVPVVDGRAVFADLVLQTAADRVTLLAEAPGCEGAQSKVFAPGRRIPGARGRPILFPDGQSVATLDQGMLSVHGPAGHLVGSAECGRRPRLRAHGRALLAVADWSGRVVLAGPDGKLRTWDVPVPEDARYTVPGALAFDDDSLYVGTWRGEVWMLTLDGTTERILEYPGGIQALAVAGDDLLVAGFDGRLIRYRAGRAGKAHELEPLLHCVCAVRDFAIVVGEERVYRLNLVDDRLVRVKLPIRAIVGVLPGGELTTVADASGQVVSFDTELAVAGGFRTVPGALPVDSALGGRLLVIEHPDGSHALAREARTGYVGAHPLAISPDGHWTASSGTPARGRLGASRGVAGPARSRQAADQRAGRGSARGLLPGRRPPGHPARAGPQTARPRSADGCGKPPIPVPHRADPPASGPARGRAGMAAGRRPALSGEPPDLGPHQPRAPGARQTAGH